MPARGQGARRRRPAARLAREAGACECWPVRAQRERSVTDRHDVVVDNQAEHRYEIRRDGRRLGFIRYGWRRGAIVLVHTEVDPSAEGQGVGNRLVAGALDDIRSRGLRMVPVCPFVAAYLRRHPEQQDLVAEGPM
ncbi:MAG TPA: GNAT family N-acetyltransferase [Capillimicrobium sp.]|nr:GNAT family N-acetyltransferase [Capillimicrobium sp.]